jgi:hypothetical protein
VADLLDTFAVIAQLSAAFGLGSIAGSSGQRDSVIRKGLRGLLIGASPAVLMQAGLRNRTDRRPGDQRAFIRPL